MPTSISSIAPALFVERRKSGRRLQQDRCAKLDIDLYHRKRRTNKDRRTVQRSEVEDIAAFYEAQMSALEPSIQ